MASSRSYTLLSGDDIWSIAASVMNDAGYTNISAAVQAIRQANQGAGTLNIFDWDPSALSALEGQKITIPYTT